MLCERPTDCATSQPLVKSSKQHNNLFSVCSPSFSPWSRDSCILLLGWAEVVGGGGRGEGSRKFWSSNKDHRVAAPNFGMLGGWGLPELSCLISCHLVEEKVASHPEVLEPCVWLQMPRQCPHHFCRYFHGTICSHPVEWLWQFPAWSPDSQLPPAAPPCPLRNNWLL